MKPNWYEKLIIFLFCASAMTMLHLDGCMKPPPVGPKPGDPSGIPCSSGPNPTTSDLCVDVFTGEPTFTSDGIPCAKCAQSSGCLMKPVGIYCVVGDCFPADPKCSRRPGS